MKKIMKNCPNFRILLYSEYAELLKNLIFPDTDTEQIWK